MDKDEIRNLKNLHDQDMDQSLQITGFSPWARMVAAVPRKISQWQLQHAQGQPITAFDPEYEAASERGFPSIDAYRAAKQHEMVQPTMDMLKKYNSY